MVFREVGMMQIYELDKITVIVEGQKGKKKETYMTNKFNGS